MPSKRRPRVTRTAPRPITDIDTNLRELLPTEPRISPPLTGVPNTPDENRVYEFGRLIAGHFFKRLSKRDLDAAEEALQIDPGEELRIAENVSVIYKYLQYQNTRDYEGIVEIHHDPYINKTYYGRWPISPWAHVRGLRGFFGITPDATTEGNKIISASGDTVVVRTTARGTQVKDFPGTALGTGGKQWAVTLIHAIEVIDGRIASCESVSPFENQFDETFIASSFPGLGGDVSEVRARQGVNADYEYLVTGSLPADRQTSVRRYDSDSTLTLERLSTLDLIQELNKQAPNQCQALISPIMRRCAKIRFSEKSLYCDYHDQNGYGID